MSYFRMCAGDSRALDCRGFCDGDWGEAIVFARGLSRRLLVAAISLSWNDVC
jgi:hypothetical protein